MMYSTSEVISYFLFKIIQHIIINYHQMQLELKIIFISLVFVCMRDIYYSMVSSILKVLLN